MTLQLNNYTAEKNGMALIDLQKRLFLIGTLGTLCALLEACSPAATILGAGASAGLALAEERPVEEIWRDTSLKVTINQRLLEKSFSDTFWSLNTTIFEGRVLLTGIVQNQESRISAVRKTWEVKGVKEVINEIDIGKKATLKEYANDVWITTQIKTIATKDIGLRALSYNFETIKGKVYIAGITSREEQLNTLIKIIENIKGVKEIVNYVVIKDVE